MVTIAQCMARPSSIMKRTGPVTSGRTNGLEHELIAPDPILEAVVRVQNCRIEELISLLPHLTWNDILREVNLVASAQKQVRDHAASFLRFLN